MVALGSKAWGSRWEPSSELAGTTILTNQGGDGSHKCLCVFHPWFYLLRLETNEIHIIALLAPGEEVIVRSAPVPWGLCLF